ncbi:MAG: type II toxin-antitoxin system VapC family toxin [Thermoplasmata archaeon]
MRALDSSFVIDLLRSVPVAVSKAAEFDGTGEIIAIPSPCVAEVVRGAQLSGRREARRTEEFLGQLEVLPLDAPAAHLSGLIAAECGERGREVPLLDCLIAGIVRVHRATLVTRDADFSCVPGLVVETY